MTLLECPSRTGYDGRRNKNSDAISQKVKKKQDSIFIHWYFLTLSSYANPIEKLQYRLPNQFSYDQQKNAGYFSQPIRLYRYNWISIGMITVIQLLERTSSNIVSPFCTPNIIGPESDYLH